MRRVFGRPPGLWVVSAVLATDGLGFLLAALDLAITAPGEWLASVASAVIGGLLLLKAYRLWCLHRGAWLIVLGVTAIGAAVHSLEIVRGHGDASTWLAVGWALITLIYLGHPSIRELFLHPEAGV